MKNVLTFIFALALTAASAQEPTVNDTLKARKTTPIDAESGVNITEDTTRVSLGSTKIEITRYSPPTDNSEKSKASNDRKSKYELSWWQGMDLGLNDIMSADYGFDLGDAEALQPDYTKSRYISFNFAELKGRIVKDYVGLTTGMSVQFYNFKYGGDTEFQFSGDSLLYAPTIDKNVTKNKLRVIYLAVPLMLEFNTSLDKSKSFHVSAGLVGKLRIGGMYKQKYEINGEKTKYKLNEDLGMNRWGADAMVRVGYGWFTVFAQVGLTPLFENANTPDVYPVAAGIFFKI